MGNREPRPVPQPVVGAPGEGAGFAFQRDTRMSQRGRSGFLSYLLLLSRLLQFEHPAEEVEAPWGGQARGWGSPTSTHTKPFP